MRFASLLAKTALVALILGPLPARAGPEAQGRAAKLSTALGGRLDSELGESGASRCAAECAPVALRPSRSDEYRQRVAREMQLAAHSRVATLGPERAP